MEYFDIIPVAARRYPPESREALREGRPWCCAFSRKTIPPSAPAEGGIVFRTSIVFSLRWSRVRPKRLAKISHSSSQILEPASLVSFFYGFLPTVVSWSPTYLTVGMDSVGGNQHPYIMASRPRSIMQTRPGNLSGVCRLQPDCFGGQPERIRRVSRPSRLLTFAMTGHII
jgi:hypothetical protein